MDRDLIPRHPIRVVARRTGLTPATIRAWERRYAAVVPVRSEGGQRLYTDRDLARLDTLRRLSEAGRSISAVASLSAEAAAALLSEDEAAAAEIEPPAARGGTPGAWADQAYARLRNLDDFGLESTLRRALATLGTQRFLEGVVAPLLGAVGRGWQSGEIGIAQEHLGSAVVERILAQLADQPAPHGDSPRLVVATLPGERHTLGARLVTAVAVLAGWRVSYLGGDLPPAEIVFAARQLQAGAVAISMVSEDAAEEGLRALAELRAQLNPTVEVLVGGRAASALDRSRLPDGVVLLKDLETFKAPSARAR